MRRASPSLTSRFISVPVARPPGSSISSRRRMLSSADRVLLSCFSRCARASYSSSTVHTAWSIDAGSLQCTGEILLQRGDPQALCFEQALEMLARVDQAARAQDTVLVEQRGERQAADLVSQPQGRRHHVRNAVEPVTAHELTLLEGVAVARQDHVHPGAL